MGMVTITNRCERCRFDFQSQSPSDRLCPRCVARFRLDAAEALRLLPDARAVEYRLARTTGRPEAGGSPHVGLACSPAPVDLGVLDSMARVDAVAAGVAASLGKGWVPAGGLKATLFAVWTGADDIVSKPDAACIADDMAWVAGEMRRIVGLGSSPAYKGMGEVPVRWSPSLFSTALMDLYGLDVTPGALSVMKHRGLIEVRDGLVSLQAAAAAVRKARGRRGGGDARCA